MSHNNVILPQASKTLSIARDNWNDSIQAIAENFFNTTPPTTSNYEIEGAGTEPPDGVLYRSSNTVGGTGLLYVKDSTSAITTSKFAGDWTTNGIGSLVVGPISTITLSDYEVGQLVKTTHNNANTRLYIKSSTGALRDVGEILDGSINESKMNAMINLGTL